MKFMNKLLLLILLLPLITLGNQSLENQFKKTDKKINDIIYLNACGGNAKEYFSKPLRVGNLNEVGNKVTSLERSPYDREFTSLATSQVTINGKAINASLENFRNLTLSDDNGNVLLDFKISGTSSLYEITHKGKVVAWGVGWHNYCKEYYDHTTFTVFRVLTPVVENDEVTIDNFVLRGAFPSLDISSNFMKEFLTNNNDLLIETKEVTSSSKPANCYYCLPVFYEFNNGFHKITSVKKLGDYLNINQYKKSDPLFYLAFLAYNDEIDELKIFIDQSYDDISSSIIDESLKNVRNHKEECLSQIQDTSNIKSIEIGVNCFPSLAFHGYFGYFYIDYSSYDKYIESGDSSEILRNVAKSLAK